MAEVTYSEWVPAGTLVKTLVGFVSFLLLCVLLIVIAVGVAIQIPFLIVVLVSPLAFVWFVSWNYRGIQIQVTNKELLISYGFLNRKHIPISNIASCKHTKTPLPNMEEQALDIALPTALGLTQHHSATRLK